MTILWAISFGTTNTNSRKDANFCNFFQVFWKFFVIFEFFSPWCRETSSRVWKGLMIDYCIVSCGNGMVFNFLPSWILAFFDKACNFFPFFWHLLSLFKFYESQGPENLISGWMTGYFKLPWNRFQLLNITNFSNFFDKIRIFFRFLKIFFPFFCRFSSFKDQAISFEVC